MHSFMKFLHNHPALLYLITFSAALVITALVTPLCRHIAARFGILDRPHTAIKTHVTPTPYLGGIAIWAGWVSSLFIIRFFTHFRTGTLHSLRGIIVGSLFIMIIGLFDDIIPKGLSYRKKFILQALAAGCILLFDIRISFISPYYLAAIFSAVWLIGISNAFNIIDIMDGLSSGVAFIASVALIFIALPTEQIYVNFCAAALAGACLGFIPYNLSKRFKIFMGDTGSLTIGFILASLAMGTSYTRLNDIGVFAPILILAIPMYDTFLVMYLRWRKGISPFLGSKDHFALRLEKMGFSRKRILIVTYTVSVVLAFSAYALTQLHLLGASILLAALLIAAFITSYRLAQVKID